MPKKNDTSLGSVVHHLSRLLTRALADEIKASGVAPGQFTVLACLWDQDGLTQRDLYQRLNIEQATMSNTLARMERDNLIKRKPDANDRRASRVHLTAHAKRLERDLTAGAGTVNKRALGALKAKDKKVLLGLMGEMIDNLEPEAD